MMSKTVAVLLCVVLSGQLASSANIFVYVILGGYSHRLSMWPLVEELAEAGHNVTFVSSYPNKNPNPKINDIVPKLWQSRMGDWSEHLNFYELRANSQILKVWAMIPSFGMMSCESLYEDDEFVEWMRSSKFDLVIVDTLMNECAYGMAHHWKAKIIVYSTANVMGWFQDSYGMPDETSSLTDPMFSWQLNEHMSFPQRFVNAMMPLLWKVVREWYYFPGLEDISRRGLQKVTGNNVEDLPSFIEIERNVSLVMVSMHHSMNFPRALPPNIVPVGGVTVPKSVKPVPKDLEDFIGNKADDQFMFISLGSVVEFTQFPPEAQAEFIAALAAFPKLKFIWKSGKEITAALPKNVKVVKWAPQTGLLAHPKMKGFVTHAGLGSTTEAIYFGVPVVSFPVFAEQDMNTAWLASRGAGIAMEMTDFKKTELEHAIKEILENPKYRKAMKTLSALFKDREVAPIKSGLWWTEFVLKHDNINEFLRPTSVHQCWFVKRQIDVWFVFAMILGLIVLIPVVVTYKVVRRLICPKRPSPKLKAGKKAN